MMTHKQKYYYAVVSATTGKLILESGNLPIFWKLSVAKKYNWKGTVIKRISDDALYEILKNANCRT